MNEVEPIAQLPRPGIALTGLACLHIAGCLVIAGVMLGIVLDGFADYAKLTGAVFAVMCVWLAALQYFAVFRRHPGAAGIIGLLQLALAGFILLPTAINVGAMLLEMHEYGLHGLGVLTALAGFGILLGWCGYLNLKWQARVVLARKKGQITNSDWQFSFRELILGVTVAAAVFGVAMWQVRSRW